MDKVWYIVINMQGQEFDVAKDEWMPEDEGDMIDDMAEAIEVAQQLRKQGERYVGVDEIEHKHGGVKYRKNVWEEGGL